MTKNNLIVKNKLLRLKLVFYDGACDAHPTRVILKLAVQIIITIAYLLL